MERFTRAALLLACLTATAIAQEAKTPPATDTLKDVTVASERERQRKSSPSLRLNNPDAMAIMRAGVTTVRLRLAEPVPEIRFRRGSAARLPTKSVVRPMELQRDLLTAGIGALVQDVTLELAAGIDEGDGLPALVPFGLRTSLVNIDYVSLRDTERATHISVTFGLDPETRKCKTYIRFVDDARISLNRFILLGDRMSDCQSAEKSREGDLFFADGVPEQLRRELRELYDPIYSRFAGMLGSEPGIVFVMWQPKSSRSDFRLETGWRRNSLLVFNGPGWEKGFDSQQKDAFWRTMTEEQIKRRLSRPDAFTKSAESYLLFLAAAGREQATSRRLKAELPQWIGACGRYLNDRSGTRKSPEAVQDCGRVLQFVYDAVARAQSKGEDTVFRVWRGQLAASFRRGEADVEPTAFMGSSVAAQQIVQGLLGGSMDWSRFATELGKFGVQIRITPDQPEPAVEVLSLTHFHD